MGTSDFKRLAPGPAIGTPLLFPKMKPERKKLASDRIEQLENRLYWSVSQDANGWTVVNNPGANIIYVSSSTGNDNNAGTIGAPVATLTKAQKLSVSGANEILLKAGDTFTESSTSNFSDWTLSGQSATSPFLLSYYGSGARPLINCGTQGVGFATGNYSTSGQVVNYLDVIGLQFDANLRDTSLSGQTVTTSAVGGAKGFEFYANGGNTLIEDCSFNYFGYNMDIEANPGTTNYLSPSISNITIRRCVDANSYAFNGGRSQGLYAYNIAGLTIDTCDFDHDGWNTTSGLGATDIGYNHDIYIASTCSGVSVVNNIIAEASYAGIMARAGGTINNNLFIDNAVAVSYGDADGADSKVGGVTGTLENNTIVGDKAEASLSSSPLAFGQGFVIANVSLSGSLMVSGNLFTGDTQNAKPAILLTMATGTTNPASAVGLNNVTIENNILNGWRYGIQTDGRFAAGGSGLYALNNLKVLDNDYINSTVQEVSHQGAFSSTQESWSGDRFFDSVLTQSSWVVLVSNTIAFSTWASTYDIGATALSVLPYTAPGRTVATYEGTVDGVSTFQDFLANASKVSITNYTTQYMAAAAATYVRGGFFVTSGNGAAPTLAATTFNVNATSIGLTSYTFTVNFTSGSLISTSSLSTGNLLVTGPNGFSQYATYISPPGTVTTDSSGYLHTPVTYRITPPSGAWATGKGQDGTYTILLLANQVSDINGNVVPDGIISTFSVDLTAPVAAVTAASVTSTASSYGFQVAYSDASGIDTTTLNSYEILVTGPTATGYSQYATLSSYTTNSTGTSVIANYTIIPPGGQWATTGTANGIYTISIGANAVNDLAGNAIASGTLGSFAVQLTGGSTAGTGSITGFVFNDANGNGVFDTREVAMVGVTMFIDPTGTGVYAAGDAVATTTNTGAYTFSGLAAGRYTIGEVTPAGYGVTTPSTGLNVVTVTTGTATTAVNFGDQVGATTVSGIGSTGTTTPTKPTDPKSPPPRIPVKRR